MNMVNKNWLIGDPTRLVIGCDLMMIIESVNDYFGKEVPISQFYVKIVWRDSGGCEYVTTYNPLGESVNTYIQSDGSLAILFDAQKYRLYYPGVLQYSVYVRGCEPYFPDGTYNYITEFQDSHITLV